MIDKCRKRGDRKPDGFQSGCQGIGVEAFQLQPGMKSAHQEICQINDMNQFAMLLGVFGAMVVSDGFNQRFRKRPVEGQACALFGMIGSEYLFFNF